MTIHSSILAQRITWTEEPRGATVHSVAKNRTRLKRLSTQAGTHGTHGVVCPGLRQSLKQATRWQHLHELQESWLWEPPQKLLKLKTCLFPLCSLCSPNHSLEAYQTWCSASYSMTPRQAPLVLCCLHPQRSPQYSHLC